MMAADSHNWGVFRALGRRLALLLPLLSCLPVTPAVSQGIPGSISSNFNGTAISAGRHIWFNSVFSYSGPTSAPVTIYFRNSSIQFTANSTDYMLTAPDAAITFSPAATLATTSFDTGTNTWVTTLPFGLSGNTFLTGLPFAVPADLPGGVNPVTWSGEFSSSAPGVCLNWKWAAAVYTSFNADPNALGVKPIDPNTGSIYLNSDHAGTAENFKSFVTGGARGGGGSNYTGSYSGTGSVCDLPVPVAPQTWSAIKGGAWR